MSPRHRRAFALAMVFALGACSSGPEAADAPSPDEAPSETGSTSAAQDIMELDYFAPLEPRTYFIDPDLDPSTPVRVVYEIPGEGWSMWIGAGKFSDVGHVSVSITTVSNCSEMSKASARITAASSSGETCGFASRIGRSANVKGGSSRGS